MKFLLKTLPILLAFPFVTYAQTDEIKQKSKEHSKDNYAQDQSHRSYSSGNNVGILLNLFFQIPFGEWQRQKLQKREYNREITSLEILLQGATNPLDYYYLFTPRIRANWGLLSTDFRVSHLIQDDFGEITDLRTDDWQIVLLNLVTTRNIIFRAGGGILHEAFGENNIYSEWTAALQLNSTNHRIGGTAEFRVSEPRWEWSAHVRYKLFDKGILHGFATGGLIYQRYYQSINIVGMQAGIVFKLY